jgi:ERCC4-type nuclease
MYGKRTSFSPVEVLGVPPSSPLSIRIDTREQRPLCFDPAYAVTSVATVKVFDYSLDGDSGWAIERKSTEDLIGSFTVGLPREMNKIEKAKKLFDSGWPLIYVVEGGMKDILTFDWNRFNKVKPQWFFSNLSAAMIEHGVQFLYCEDRMETAIWIYKLLRARFKTLNNLK